MLLFLLGVFCLLLEITMNFNYFLEIGCKFNDISSYYGYLYKKYYIGLTFFNIVTTMSSNTYVQAPRASTQIYSPTPAPR